MRRHMDSPEAKRAYADREVAQTRFDVVRAGIAENLKGGYFCSMEELTPLLDIANGDLVTAMGAVERTNEAYRPFMYRRRRRVLIRNPKKKKPVTKATKAGAA